jgi:hypothetical protein
MAFGQSSGPPATAKQVQQLSELVTAAGHDDFRDARGPLGLNQRQAAGKFTRDEADALIARLQAEAEEIGAAESPATEAPAPPPVVRAAPKPRPTVDKANPLRNVPSSVLAAELQRRGWVVMEP